MCLITEHVVDGWHVVQNTENLDYRTTLVIVILGLIVFGIAVYWLTLHYSKKKK